MESEIISGKTSWSFNPFSYSGRIGRLNYLLGLLLVCVVSAIYEITIFYFGTPFFFTFSQSPSTQTLPPVISALLLPFILSIIVAWVPLWLSSSFRVKRFHDLNLPGKYIFGIFVPGYKFTFVTDVIYTRGTVGRNDYGEDPTPNTKDWSLAVWFSHHRVVYILVIVIMIVGYITSALIGKIIDKQDSIKQQKSVVQAYFNNHSSAYIPTPIATSSISKENTLDTSKWRSLSVPLSGNAGCYTVKYPTELILANDKNTPSGFAIFKDTKNNPIVEMSATYLGDMDTLAKQVVSNRDPNPNIKSFVTTSGLQEREVLENSGWWTILISTFANYQNGDTLVVSLFSKNRDYLKTGENIARTITLSTNCK